MGREGLGQDVRIAVRGLLRSPGFTVAALVTLALGLGATAAMFSVVQSVILEPLPYARPGDRVLIWSRWTSFDKTWLSDEEILDYRRLSRTMTDVAGWTSGQQNLTGDGDPVRIGVGFVMANTFDVLGARPLLGRVFRPEEDVPDGPPVAVLGYRLWQARYGGDPGIVGRTILLNDVPVEVLGVMPQGFRLPTDFTEDAAEPSELWRPIQFDPANLSRGSHGYYAAGVLAPGQSAASASAELAGLTRQMTADGLYPEAMRFTAFAVPLEEEIRGAVKPAMWLLSGAVLFLLLIACTNVANLLLVRGDARVREIAVRTAIGASPRTLVRQLLVESLVLALAGAALGLALAAGALRVLVALAPASLPPLAPIALDGRVVLFAMGLGLLTTLLFGLAPALRALRVDLVDSLREGGHQATVGGKRQRARGLLVSAEVALAVILVIGAGLMIRSLAALGRVDLGFDPDHVLTMRLALPQASYETPEEVAGFYRRLLDEVRGMSGVEAAGVVRVLPLATTIGDYGLDVDGYEESPGHNAKGDWQIVSAGAFEAMGARLVRGRWFTEADTEDAAPVAVINETMARTYWRDEAGAIGGRIRVGSNADRPWATVVGIVADERHNGVTGIVKEKFYIPHPQWPVVTGGSVIRNVFLVARTTGDPMAAAAPIRAAVRRMDPKLPVASVRPMQEVVAAALATPRLTGFLLSAFAAIALALAAVGIYGVLAYFVARRTHEIGIRIAVGANDAGVLALIMGHGLRLAGAGILVGTGAALLLTRLMSSLLYGVAPSDPVTFVVVPVALAAVAALASAIPALRAMRVSPVVALRSE
ncbi:MAG: ABC transporter permease [Vicinamibacterales bacterium]